MNQQNWHGRGRDRGGGHIIQMLNVTIAENMDTVQRSVMPRKEWKKVKI